MLTHQLIKIERNIIKNMIIREIRLFLFVSLINIAMKVLPDDAIETYEWLIKMPYQK